MPEQPSNFTSFPSQPAETPDLRAGVLARLESRRATLAARTPLDALHDAHWEVRAAAVRALGETADTAGELSLNGAYTALIGALEDEHRLVRGAAIQALVCAARALANNPTTAHDALADVVSRLSIALHDTEWETRELAALALATALKSGLVSSEEAQPLLTSTLNDTANPVREAAQAAEQLAAKPQARQTIPTVAWHGKLATPGRQRIALYAQAFIRQARVIRREAWLVMICGALATVALAGAIHLRGGTYDYAVALAFTLAGASAISMAFLARSENDPAVELTMATPVSLRFLLASRLALMLGYNFALALAASALIAWISGEPLLAIAQGWVGPLLLLSALTLALSLLAGTTIAFVATLLLDATQIMRTLTEPLRGALNAGPALDTLRVAAIHLWGANPLALSIIALAVVIVALLAPQRPSVEQKEA